MARRILSADSALMPQSQVSLNSGMPVPVGLPIASNGMRGGDVRPHLLAELQQRWTQPGGPVSDSGAPLFDWRDRGALMAEIDLVNRAQAILDEAAVKLAPSLLRIVLTVKANLPEVKAQRQFLAEHVQLDFRRISELCIVADSYGLVDPRARDAGAAEIERYGWSSALKLAYVRDPSERRAVWERACAGRPHAAYRDVLEQIQLFRERKLIAAPAPRDVERRELVRRMSEAQAHVTRLAALTPRLRSPSDYRGALELLETVQKELATVRRTFQEHLEAEEPVAMAAQA
jgi:hypothetical protein